LKPPNAQSRFEADASDRFCSPVLLIICVFNVSIGYMPIPQRGQQAKPLINDDGTLTQLARDASDASRQEATRPADIADIFHLVYILGEEEFLWTKNPLSERVLARAATGDGTGRTEASYVKNLIADSGKIFTTDNPLPTQKAATPPSAYIRATADIIALRPRTRASGCSDVPPRSGGLVIRKTLRRSNGAVAVRDTVLRSMRA
jgi:hypothetical protein